MEAHYKDKTVHRRPSHVTSRFLRPAAGQQRGSRELCDDLVPESALPAPLLVASHDTVSPVGLGVGLWLLSHKRAC